MAKRQIQHAYRQLRSSRPFLGVGIIRDDSNQLKELIAILIALSWFCWQHRQTILELAENINTAFVYLQSIQESWLEFRRAFFSAWNPYTYVLQGICLG